jgi:predicted transcriptional regulator
VGPENRLVDLISFVWTVGKDGEWHTAREIANLVGSTPSTVETILDFFTKYGFAKRSVSLHEDKYQLMVEGPSPMETVAVLRFSQMEAQQSTRIT